MEGIPMIEMAEPDRAPHRKDANEVGAWVGDYAEEAVYQAKKQAATPWGDSLEEDEPRGSTRKAWFALLGVFLGVAALSLTLFLVHSKVHFVTELPLTERSHPLAFPLGEGRKLLREHGFSFVAANVAHDAMTVTANGSAPIVRRLSVPPQLGSIDDFDLLSTSFLCRPGGTCYKIHAPPDLERDHVEVNASAELPLPGAYFMLSHCTVYRKCILLTKKDGVYTVFSTTELHRSTRPSFSLEQLGQDFGSDAVLKAFRLEGSYGWLAVLQKGALTVCNTEVYGGKRVTVGRCHKEITRASEEAKVDLLMTSNGFVLVLVKEPREEGHTRVRLYVVGGAEGIQMANSWMVDVAADAVAFLRPLNEQSLHFSVCHLYDDRLLCRDHGEEEKKKR